MNFLVHCIRIPNCSDVWVAARCTARWRPTGQVTDLVMTLEYGTARALIHDFARDNMQNPVLAEVYPTEGLRS